MNESLFSLKPIGVIYTPFEGPRGTPIQASEAGDVSGTVIVDPEYVDGLADLEGFERIWLIYRFHASGSFKLKVVPFRDDREHGLFATRAPSRPNPIGISPVKLIRIVKNEIFVSGVDVIDGTPLLDIKPYVPAFDSFQSAKAGWLDDCRNNRRIADDRFSDG